MKVPELNLLLAWTWLLLGFVSGMCLGLYFRDEKWLGGYGSFRRRLYRLAHISFFGLGAVNLCFFLTLRAWPLPPNTVLVAGWSFIVGALAMPVCCLLLAHFPRTHLLFMVPVLSLLLGGILTVLGLSHSLTLPTLSRL